MRLVLSPLPSVQLEHLLFLLYSSLCNLILQFITKLFYFG